LPLFVTDLNYQGVKRDGLKVLAEGQQVEYIQPQKQATGVSRLKNSPYSIAPVHQRYKADTKPQVQNLSHGNKKLVSG